MKSSSSSKTIYLYAALFLKQIHNPLVNKYVDFHLEYKKVIQLYMRILEKYVPLAHKIAIFIFLLLKIFNFCMNIKNILSVLLLSNSQKIIIIYFPLL